MCTVVIGSLLLLAMASATSASPIKCQISAKFACTPSGCSENKLGMWNVIDIESGKFSRCDLKGCDDYPATFNCGD